MSKLTTKKSLTDNFQMNLLLWLLCGEAKQIVSAIGSNETFYALCLKALKRESGNPHAAAPGA